MYSHQNETIASFSHGMRQNDFDRHVAARSRYLGIDELLQGLDPQAAFDLKEMMKAHAAKGKTVIFLHMYWIPHNSYAINWLF